MEDILEDTHPDEIDEVTAIIEAMAPSCRRLNGKGKVELLISERVERGTESC